MINTQTYKIQDRRRGSWSRDSKVRDDLWPMQVSQFI